MPVLISVHYYSLNACVFNYYIIISNVQIKTIVRTSDRRNDCLSVCVYYPRWWEHLISEIFFLRETIQKDSSVLIENDQVVSIRAKLVDSFLFPSSLWAVIVTTSLLKLTRAAGYYNINNKFIFAKSGSHSLTITYIYSEICKK